MPFTLTYFCAIMENARTHISIITPPIIHANMPSGRSPIVMFNMVCALKNTPEPITMPTTMHMAVNKPYFFFN